jgi:hypothetical protein
MRRRPQREGHSDMAGDGGLGTLEARQKSDGEQHDDKGKGHPEDVAKRRTPMICTREEAPEWMCDNPFVFYGFRVNFATLDVGALLFVLRGVCVCVCVCARARESKDARKRDVACLHVGQSACAEAEYALKECGPSRHACVSRKVCEGVVLWSVRVSAGVCVKECARRGSTL